MLSDTAILDQRRRALPYGHSTQLPIPGQEGLTPSNHLRGGNTLLLPGLPPIGNNGSRSNPNGLPIGRLEPDRPARDNFPCFSRLPILPERDCVQYPSP